MTFSAVNSLTVLKFLDSLDLVAKMYICLQLNLIIPIDHNAVYSRNTEYTIFTS